MVGTGIIYTDNDSEGIAALFGRTSAATQQYIQSNVQQYIQQVGGTIQNLATDVMSRFNAINSAVSLARIENMRNRLNYVWQADSIRPLHTLVDMQQAPPVMQRWVMAHPVIRASWNREGCSGYDGNYVDHVPGGVAERHYDYRRVMNGVVHDGKYTNYHEIILNENDLLTLFEKTAVMKTWDSLDSIIDDTNADPTDPWGSGTMG